MLNIQITESTPANMLRAIRAACNELLGERHTDLTAQAAQHVTNANELQDAADAEAHRAAAALSAHNDLGRASTIQDDLTAVTGEIRTPEQTVLAAAFDKTVEAVGAPTIAAALLTEQAEELDSAGQPWIAELHSSSRAKIADGTWKKRRGAAVTDAPAAPPPLPPAAPTTEPIMPKIFALITSQICTINDAVAAAQAEGYADLGANGLGGAPREAQEAVLRKLEG